MLSSHRLMTKCVYGMTHRTDLDKWMQSVLCHEKKEEQDFISSAWDFQVFDVGMRIKKIVAKNSTLKKSFLKSQAIELMQKNYHLSYSYGLCSNKTGWILSSPALNSIQYSSNSIKVEEEPLRKHCRSYSLNYVRPSSGRSTTIVLKKDATLKFDHLHGFVSLRCYPKTPNWLGPVGWFLIPINLNKLPSLPLHELLTDKKYSQQQRMQNWINGLRLKNDLNFINFDHKMINNAVKYLSVQDTILHNHKLMGRVEHFLANHKFKAIGENRVIAKSLNQLAWSLWYSPSHRDLLLSEEGQLGALNLISNDKSNFMVFLLAAKQS